MRTRFHLAIVALVATIYPSVAHAVTAGAGLTISNGSLSTLSSATNFLATSSAVSCSSSTGKLLLETTANTLGYCNGSTAYHTALGDTSGNATSLNTGAGTDGSRGVTLNDNTSNPAGLSSNTTMVHSMGGNLYVYGQTGPATTSPGMPVLPIIKTGSSGTQPISTAATTSMTDVTNLSFTIKASTKYLIDGSLYVDASAGTADPTLTFLLGATTNAAVYVQVICQMTTAATAVQTFHVVTSGSTSQNCAIGAAQSLNITFHGFVLGPSTGNTTLKLQAAPAGAGTLTIDKYPVMRVVEFQ